MKRILILTYYYEPDLCAGSFRNAELVKALNKYLQENDVVDVITTVPNRYKSYKKDGVDNFERVKNFFIYRIDVGSHNSGFVDQSLAFKNYMFGVFKLTKNKDYDIVYASSSRLMTAFLGSLIAKKKKSLLVIDIRDIFTDTLKSLSNERVIFKYLLPIFKQIEKFTFSSARYINLVSKGFEQYFLSINSHAKYTFYTNGIDEIFLNKNYSSYKQNDKKVILYAGNIGEGQGLDKIIPDIAKFLGEEYVIKIVGDGGTKNKLEKAVENIKNVKLISPVNRSELLNMYMESSCLFLHLNNYEAFEKVLPSKIFEYAATNKFIIAGVNGYAKEFLETEVDGCMVFEPCNIDDFKNKFSKIKKEQKIDRQKFIEKYNRINIMQKFAKDIYFLEG